jgi:hypothetical protein
MTNSSVTQIFSGGESLYFSNNSFMTTEIEISSGPVLLAKQIAARFEAIPQVEAVALAGSQTSPFADQRSDIDLYVYASEPVALSSRAKVARDARQAEIGNSFWEPGDEWIDGETGISVDVMFRATPWIEIQLDRVLRRHEASVGYSTCFWYNVRNSQPLFDRTGWFERIQERARQQYPAELKRAIVEKNHPVLRTNMSSYVHQIELALQRRDTVSVNHRVTALLASYFDIVFAVNEQPHPGEKRVLQFARALCPKLPTDMEARMEALLSALPDGDIVGRANTMLDGLDDLLKSAGFFPGPRQKSF